MSDDFNDDGKPPMILVQGEDGVFRKAETAPIDGTTSTPEPLIDAEQPTVDPANSSGNSTVDAEQPTETVENAPIDAGNSTPETASDATTEPTPTPPAPTPPANMMSPEELAEYDSETVRLVSSQESAVCQLEAELADIKSQTKAAKKAVEEAKEELRELIQNRDRQRGRKPAPSLSDSPAHATDQVHDDQAATSEPGPVDPLAELWREYPIKYTLRWSGWGLTAKDIERLNSGETKTSGVHPITKLGDVTRFITPNPDSPAFTRTLKDFKGFGDAAYDRWLSAETQFWDWWNNKGGKQSFADEQAGKVDAA